MAHSTVRSEDALFELGMRLERLLKKYRVALIAAAIALAAWLIVIAAQSYANEKRLEAANKALNVLLSDPVNEEARQTLQAKSPELYDLFALIEASRSKNTQLLEQIAQKQSIASDLAAYQLASLSEESDRLARFSTRETKMLKEFASLSEAFLLLKKGEFTTARALLDGIDINSELKNIANALSHYGVAKQ
ncbi:MAG: hypothetical protein LBN32_03665 [Helicobacteraceae bacterium]|jgi:hypothetical protein|nr:hypothetical protein [Helicobacteraceae bacterium]